MDVAIIGYGVVGSGVVEVIKKNSQSIAGRAGERIRVKKILDIRDFTGGPDLDLLTKKPEEVFDDPEISVIVETIGGARIAFEYTKKAFAMKKHVVTSNKELVATHGPELLKMAADNGVSYLFEASVGGGIPIIRPLNQCLAANIINGITGILNGTTNYILTQMRKEGRDFADALKSAQQNGYAEADPTADIEGHDACRKIAILSSIAYNEFVDYKNIHTEGITKLSLSDMRYAEAMDSVIKLVAVSRREGGKIYARVAPAIISKNHPLANVEDVFNAIVVRGDAIGDAMFYGRGAGKLPTASAVVADIIDIARHIESGAKNVWIRQEVDNTVPIAESEIRFFVRVAVRNEIEAVKFINKTFNKVEYIHLGHKEQSGCMGEQLTQSTTSPGCMGGQSAQPTTSPGCMGGQLTQSTTSPGRMGGQSAQSTTSPGRMGGQSAQPTTSPGRMGGQSAQPTTSPGELAFTTRKATEAELVGYIETLKGIGSIREVLNVIRIEED